MCADATHRDGLHSVWYVYHAGSFAENRVWHRWQVGKVKVLCDDNSGRALLHLCLQILGSGYEHWRGTVSGSLHDAPVLCSSPTEQLRSENAWRCQRSRRMLHFDRGTLLTVGTRACNREHDDRAVLRSALAAGAA